MCSPMRSRARFDNRAPPRSIAVAKPNSEVIMIIDCHGHYTTEPKDLHRFRKEQTAAANAKDKVAMPSRASLKISDDEIRDSIEANQLKLQRERGTDLTIFSPRASGHGPSHRRRECQPRMVADLQRPYPSRLRALSAKLHRRVPIAAIAGRAAAALVGGARTLRQGTRFYRLQSQSRSVRRLLEFTAAHRQVVVSVVREDGRARRAGDDPCSRAAAIRRCTPPALIISTPTPWRSCSSSLRPVQGFSDAQIDHSARRRRGAVPLGPLPRAGAQ